jgi:50S ribosomal protein L16 3-hydroxylase
VFLLQVQGQRRWRWGRQRDLQLREDVPLKILERFEPEHEAVLEPGDMLYLPPRYAHDGIAEGECQTCAIGFRAPARAELARELLQRIADHAEDDEPRLYADAGQPALARSAQVPPALQAFAVDAVRRALDEPGALEQSLGETLTEPKANVVFTGGRAPRRGQGVVLDRRTRMLYDDRHVFVNGESWRAGGADARLMRKLADERSLSAADLARASEDARELLAAWCAAGWAHGGGER